jgi:lipopolysaccharide export system protein LptC
MSRNAEASRARLRAWAASGGPHERRVRWLQLLLPAGVGALAAVLLFAPFSQRGELSFLLAKDAIDIAPQRLFVGDAVYRGRDNGGRAFTLTAGSAIQRSAADPAVRISNLSAQIMLSDGPARVTAPRAVYNPDTERVEAPGTLTVRTADGFSLASNAVTVDLNRRQLQSGAGGVSGTLPIGRFSADRMRANLETRVIRLDGHARLRINQGAVR